MSASRGGIRIVGSIAIVALAVTLFVLARRFLGDDPAALATSAATVAANAAAPTPDGSAASSVITPDAPHVDAPAAPSRAVEPAELLAPPPRDYLAELEASGRVLFFGVVTGFDDAPCPGASIFHDGVRVGSSDALGRYRVEAAQNAWNPMSETRWSNFLAAVKEGVGSVAVDCNGASRRIDLKLQCKTLFAGRCIQRRSREPVAGARVELLCVLNNETAAPLYSLATTSDEEGAFQFVGVAPQRVELRAIAEGFASDGWFPFDVSNGKDRTNVEFELERIAHARGWFTPWPPPALASKPAAADARVVAIAGTGRDGGPEVAPIVAPVAADGSFDVAFATCMGIDFVLEAGGGALWRERLGHDFDGGDVDFGRILLGDPITLTGRVALPREVLELGFDLLAVVRLETGSRHLRFPIALDGSFRAEPLPPGRLLWGVVLGDHLVIAQSLKVFSGERDTVFGDDEELEPGSRHDLGVLAPSERVVVGRVTLASGSVASGATMQWPVRMNDTLVSMNLFDGRREVDARGRYVLKIDLDVSETDNPWAKALAEPLRLFARRRDDVGRSALFHAPATGTAARCDVVLEPGRVLRGSVVDASGAPLAKGHLSLMPQIGESATALWLDYAYTTTGPAGEFELTGLEDADYRARLLIGDKWLELGTVRPGGPAITLTARAGG